MHGDFGPDDLVLGADGPRIVRFSITPPYGTATPAADLYSWAQTILFAGSGTAAVPDPARLPEPLRNAVSACLAEPASRPQARALLTALLGQSDPAAGLLAEGTRRARAAGRGVVGPSQPAADELPPRSATRRAGFIGACAACVAAIAVATTLIVTHHSAAPHPGRRGHRFTPARPSPATVTASPTPTPKPPGRTGRHLVGHGTADRPGAGRHRPDPADRGLPGRDHCLPAARLLRPAAAGGRRGGSYTLEQGITSGQQSCDSGVVTLTQQASPRWPSRSGAPAPPAPPAP